MPRTARKKSKSGIYHIMLRGINRQDLFEDNEDREKFIETIGFYKEKSGYKIYAYCLMNNHVHILLEEEKEPIALIMKRISSSFVYYYNRKYSRCGHLFQERFKSETVEDNSYFLTVLRYINQNPIKANITSAMDAYKWSSYTEYVERSKIVDVKFVIDIFSEDQSEALQSFIRFNNEENQDNCLEYEEKKRMNDDEAREIIKNIAEIKNISELQSFDKQKRDKIIRKMKEIEGVSIRQITRITGLNYNLVLKL